MSNDQPRWGENSGETEEPPRYGERIVPTPGSTDDAPTRAYDVPPVHGPQGASPYQPAGAQYQPASTDRSPWDQQQAYGTQTSSPSSSWDSPAVKRKSRAVGVIAFIVAVLALIAAIVIGVLWADVFAHVPAFKQLINSGKGTMTAAQQQQIGQDFANELTRDPSLRGPFTIGTILFLVGTVLGLWAIVQGIVAIVTRRGRVLGVIALVIAVIAPIVLTIVLGSVLASSV